MKRYPAEQIHYKVEQEQSQTNREMVVKCSLLAVSKKKTNSSIGLISLTKQWLPKRDILRRTI